MQTCQIPKKQIASVRQYLKEHAFWQPLDASCQIAFEAKDKYILRIQQGKRQNEILLLQAIRITRKEKTEKYMLITNGHVLEALFYLAVMEQL